MSKYKLIISSIKNQMHIYVIYIISLTLALTLFLSFINLVMSTIMATQKYMTNTNVYIIISFLLGGFLCTIIVFLMNYVQNLLVNARSKELAVYRLVSFSRREMRKYLFVEQLLINTFSFVIALLLSFILSSIVIDEFNSISEQLLGVNINLKFSMITFVYEVIAIITITIIIALHSSKKIEKKELIDLLNTKQALPLIEKKNHPLLSGIIVFITWIGLIYILIYQFGRLKPLTVLIVLSIYIISIFSLYDVLAKLVVKLIPNRIYYNNSNSFTISIIKRKLATNVKSMAFVTILILLSTITIFFGFINTKFISFLAMYEDVHYSDNLNVLNLEFANESLTFEFNDTNFNAIDDLDFELLPDAYSVSEYSYNKFAKKNGLEQIHLQKNQAFILTNKQGINVNNKILGNIKEQSMEFTIKKVKKITNDQDLTIVVVDDEYNADRTEYFDSLLNDLKKNGANPRQTQFKNSDLSLYKQNKLVTQNVNVMSESIANKFLKQNDLPQFKFKLNDEQAAYIGSIKYNLEDDYKLKVGDKTYTLVHESQKLGKKLGFGMFVLNDKQYTDYEQYTINYIEADYTEKYSEEFWKKQKNSHQFPGAISTKNQRNTLMLMTNILLSGILIFSSLILLLLLITIIGIQVNIDSIETKEQFKNLHQIGYSKKHINQIINQITFIYFIIPLIVGIMNLLIVATVFKKFLKDMTTLEQIYSTGLIRMNELVYIALSMLIIYIIYCFIVNQSYKHVIEKNFN